MFSYVILCIYVILVNSRNGFEDRIWVLIAQVPGYCLLVAAKGAIRYMYLVYGSSFWLKVK